MKQAPPGRLSVSLWGDRMDRGKSVELWFVQVQEVHQYQEVHVRADEQPWSSQNYGCGTGQMMRRLMGGNCMYSKLGEGGGHWLNNPIYTPPEQPPPVDNICGMECPLRTVAKHLSRVSSQSLDRTSVYSPATSSSIDDSVRVTGDQGLVWSSNPVFADDFVPGHPYADSGPSSRISSRLSSRIASRTSRISSAFELERMPLPRIRTNHERDMTEDSAKNLAAGAMSGVSPVVSGFYTGRTDSRDFDSACQNYRATAEWLNPEQLCSELRSSPRLVDRGVQTGPDRDSCMDDLVHEFRDQNLPKIGRLKDEIQGKENEISMLMDVVSASRSQEFREQSLSKLGKLKGDIADKEDDIDLLFDVVSTSRSSRRSSRRKVTVSFSDALSEIHKLREMIQQQDLEIATLYQEVAREISALAKMGSVMATPRASVPWGMATHQAILPWSTAGAKLGRVGYVSKRGSPRSPSRQDSLEGDTLSRLEVQVQVLSEQLQVLEDQLRQQKRQQNTVQRTASPTASSDDATVIIDSASIGDLESDDPEMAGYEVVVNPFFEGHKSPMYYDSASDDVPICDPPYYDYVQGMHSFWPNQTHINSVVALQQLVAESDAEIARLSAELDVGTNENGAMRGNPVFDAYNPYQQGVLVA